MSEATGNSTNEHRLTALPVELPPNLMELIGYPGAARYIALYYMGSKATWDDGLASTTFSFYNAYEPLISHPALAIHLLEANLGNDDEYPTHALLCDREGNKFLVGCFDDVRQLVRSQISDDERRQAGERYAALFSEPASLSDFLARGMFEVFTRPSAAQVEGAHSLRAWLDRFITKELIERYLKMFKEGDFRAMQPLEYIRGLCGRARKGASQ